MSLRYFLLIIVLVFQVSQTKAEDLTNNIEMAISSGDYFSAYRLGVAFEEENESAFLKSGVDGYLKSLFVIGSKKQVLNECDRLAKKAVKAAYLCALNAIEEVKPELAQKYFKKIDAKSKFHYPAQILRATAAMLESDFETAANFLNPEEIEKYKELQLEQLFYLTRARALIGGKRFEEATKYSQSVDSKTPYYVEALEQTAWIFFKTRKFESSQILLDVIVSTYESPQKIESDLKISPTLYYKARYLKAYLALLEQRPEGAANEFSQLKNDYDKFMLGFKNENVSQEFSKIKSEPIVSSEIKTIVPKIENKISFIKDWIGAETAVKLRRDIKLQAAINNEVIRLKKANSSEVEKYLSIVEKLKVQSLARVEKEYSATFIRLTQAMNTLSLKCELGRLDVFWLNRAQGARNLEEVIDNYKESTKSIEAYVDL